VRVAALKLEGAESAEVSLKRAVADIRLRPGNRTTLSEVRALVTSNGFKPREAVVTAIGTFTQDGGRPSLKIAELNETVSISTERTAASILKDVRDATATAGNLVEVTGTIEAGPAGNDELVVTAFARKAR
jgi:hypothetical protein